MIVQYQQCENCSTLNDIDAVFCKKCGSRLVLEQMFDISDDLSNDNNSDDIQFSEDELFDALLAEEENHTYITDDDNVSSNNDNADEDDIFSSLNIESDIISEIQNDTELLNIMNELDELDEYTDDEFSTEYDYFADDDDDEEVTLNDAMPDTFREAIQEIGDSEIWSDLKGDIDELHLDEKMQKAKQKANELFSRLKKK